MLARKALHRADLACPRATANGHPIHPRISRERPNNRTDGGRIIQSDTEIPTPQRIQTPKIHIETTIRFSIQC